MNTPYHEKPYETGYGKPPKAHRFKKGQSGNPKGRKKGSKNLKTDLEEILKSKIPISEGGKKKTVTKQHAMIMALIAKALKGDVKATNTGLKLVADTVGYDPQAEKAVGLSAEDTAILDQFVEEEIRRKGITLPDPETDPETGPETGNETGNEAVPCEAADREADLDTALKADESGDVKEPGVESGIADASQIDPSVGGIDGDDDNDDDRDEEEWWW